MLTDLMFFFFFNDTATTEIYSLSLHDALPIFALFSSINALPLMGPRVIYAMSRDRLFFHQVTRVNKGGTPSIDRKSTRLNSSHANISYAVFCLKKKKKSR